MFRIFLTFEAINPQIYEDIFSEIEHFTNSSEKEICMQMNINTNTDSFLENFIT